MGYSYDAKTKNWWNEADRECFDCSAPILAGQASLLEALLTAAEDSQPLPCFASAGLAGGAIIQSVLVRRLI